MNWLPAILVMGAAVLIGTAIAFMMEKTFENMEKTSKYFKQVAEDLIIIEELLK